MVVLILREHVLGYSEKLVLQEEEAYRLHECPLR